MERERPPLDVLVVGAGPVGLTAACELARRGVTVRIIDKAPAIPATSRALAIFPRTLEVFTFMGMASRIIEAGRRLEGISISNERGPLAQLDLGGLSTPYPFALSLAQSETERLLAAHLTDLGVEVQRGVELVGFAQDENGVRAILRNAGGAPNTEKSVRASWLLGCDGAHSTVRHILGAAFEGAQYREAFVLADVKLTGALSLDLAHLFFSKDGFLGIVPFGTGEARIIVNLPVLPPEKSGPEPTLADFQAFVRQRGAHQARLSDATWISRFNIAYRKVKQFQHGRVFLAGDAAHIHSPAGGQGMNTGIQDAYNLAWKLALVMHGQSPAGLLESYGAEREPVARGVLHFTDRLTRMATARSVLGRQLRDFALPWLFRLKGVTDRAARRIAELDIHYPDSSLSEDYSGEPLRAGDRAPDAMLIDQGSGKPVQLFELFRDSRHVLLAFEGLHSRPESRGEIEGLLRELETPYSEVIAIHPVVRGFAFRDAATLIDRSGAVHLLYDTDAGGVVLVRPDGYIGFRSDWARAGKLRSYLSRLFVEPPRMSSASA